MSDRLFFSLAGAAAAFMVLLSLVWPQGTGARSPFPFGHDVTTAAARK
jgi:hypothetical protein